MSEKKKSSAETANHPLLEWIIAFIGLILVVSVLSFMVYLAVTSNKTPPDIVVNVESIRQTSAGYQVLFAVTNKGDLTAAQVTIEGELKRGGEILETGSATLTYVPALSVRRGGLFFRQNPQEFELDLRAKGYESP